jgi:hypothetical protein
MTLQLAHVTFDCADPSRVSAFWSAATGRPVDDGANQYFASIGFGDKLEAKWVFITVPESKTAKNRVHLDMHAEDREAEVARLVGLGATRVADHDEHGTRWTVLTDVEGNEFCVAAA